MPVGGAELGKCPSHPEALCWLPGAYHSFAWFLQTGEDGQTLGCRGSSPNPHLPPRACCHRWHFWLCEMTALLTKDSSALSSFECAEPWAIYSTFSSVSEWISESFHLCFRWEVQHLAEPFESVSVPVSACRGG